MGKDTVDNEATIHLQIENIFKDEMAFDGDIDRILSTLRNHIGNPVGITHDGCHYYIDTGKFGIPIEDFDDWYNAFIDMQESEILRRRQSKGFPKGCSDIYSDEFTSSFYKCNVAGAFGVGQNVKTFKTRKDRLNSRLVLQFRFGTSYRKSDIEAVLNREITIHTRRGKLGRSVHGPVGSIFTNASYEQPTGSGYTAVWVHTPEIRSCEWLSEMAHIGLEKKLDIDDITLRAWPTTGWDYSLSHQIGGHVPEEWDEYDKPVK